jgi:hypothetical protein
MSECSEVILKIIIWGWAIATVIRIDIAVSNSVDKSKAKGEQP